MRFDKIYYVSSWDYEAGALLRPGIFCALTGFQHTDFAGGDRASRLF